MAPARDDSPSERDRRELTALADGVLAAAPRPDSRRASRARRRCARAWTASGARSPRSARSSSPHPLACAPGSRPRPESRRRAGSHRSPGRAPRPAVAAVAVAIVVLAGGAAVADDRRGRRPGRPSRRRLPAPAPRPDQPTLLAAEAEGLAFPDWSGEFGWRASGERDDRLGDRDATTVYYAKDGGRIAYTIVSGEPLERDPDAATTTIDGVDFAVTARRRADGRHLVARRAHLRALGRRRAARTLVELAAWKGDGAVAF